MPNALENKIIGLIEPVGGHGGMDYYDYGLAAGLGNHGLKVHYYTCDRTNERFYSNVTTHKTFKNVWGKNFLVKVSNYIFGHVKAYKELSGMGCNLVHLHFFSFRAIDLLVLYLAKYYGMTTIVTVHDVSSFHGKSSSTIEKKCYELIDGVIVHNQYSFRTLQSKQVVKCPIAIIPHGNYLPFIQKLPDEKNKSFTLLFFGQIKQVKGLDILLNATSILKKKGVDIQLLIAGKAWKSDLDEYIKMITDLEIGDITKTDFRYVPDDEVASFYSKADLLVLPYREIYQSGVLLLSMSYGKPILCANLPAFADVIKDEENGFLFEQGNAESLAVKVEQIVSHPDLLQVAVNGANQIIKTDYDWNKIGVSTADFYNKCVVEKKARKK